MALSLVVAVPLACAFAGLGAAKIAKTPSMLRRADHVGFTALSDLVVLGMTR